MLYPPNATRFDKPSASVREKFQTSVADAYQRNRVLAENHASAAFRSLSTCCAKSMLRLVKSNFEKSGELVFAHSSKSKYHGRNLFQ